MELNYIGEHLLPGQAGHFFVVLSFVSALLSTLAYFNSANEKSLQPGSWLTIGRQSFYVHALSVFAITGTLFYIITQHYFEYQYAWQHSSRDLPLRYMLSCFWEGQEGSFLLWTLWHVVLGFFLYRHAKEWESHTMTVFMSVQVFLASMLLGIYFFDYRLGSNPFMLLREHPDFANLPFTRVPDYLKGLDGRGLNPLLQNYWMTIHPPVLFLGFASTLIPFAYAMAGLWRKQHDIWIKKALPWAFFSIMILGTGVLMGGAWAYESLSFGGFWAWDPVENASLVPWLTLVGGAHVMIIYAKRKNSLFTAYALIILTFLLILYSTFLTRSGILGNSSVHAFTDLGMSGQLLVYLLFYVLVALILLLRSFKQIYTPGQEDASSSREFWMFTGSLVLLVSAFQITFSTSIPVINKVFNTSLAPPSNVVAHYNSWQIPFAIMVALLIGIGQFLKYRQSKAREILRNQIFSLLLSLVLTTLVMFYFQCKNIFFILLFFATCYAVSANAYYWVKILKGKIRNAGASVAHIGFALILMGALLSAGFSRIISANTSGVDISKLGKDFSNFENIMLSRNDTLKMGEYYLTYTGKRVEGINHYYDIDYLEKGPEGKYHKIFRLSPLIQTNPRMGNAAEPDTRHYFFKDVYTHITYADLDNGNENNPVSETHHNVKPGDTLFAGNSYIIFENIYKLEEADTSSENIAIGARLIAYDIRGNAFEAKPVFRVKKNRVVPEKSEINALGLSFMFTRVYPETGKIDLTMKEDKRTRKDFIILKAIVFPFINILWLGCLVMIIGSLLAIFERIKKVSCT